MSSGDVALHLFKTHPNHAILEIHEGGTTRVVIVQALRQCESVETAAAFLGEHVEATSDES